VNESTASVLDLGLMGGMFDPVHQGHLKIALTTLENLQMDAIRLLPCGNPVHRGEVFASAQHRLAMLRLAVESYSDIGIDDRELNSDEPSFTLTSLQKIKQEQPDARLFFIMGQDAFNNFHTWHRWHDIFLLTHIIVAARPGYQLNPVKELETELKKRMVPSIEKLKQTEYGKIFITEYDLLDISSSIVRETVLGHKSLAGLVPELVPEKVAHYIDTHKLYAREADI